MLTQPITTLIQQGDGTSQPTKYSILLSNATSGRYIWSCYGTNQFPNGSCGLSISDLESAFAEWGQFTVTQISSDTIELTSVDFYPRAEGVEFLAEDPENPLSV